MSIFTSRYVASLEQQVKELKEQLARKEAQIETLISQRIQAAPDSGKEEKKEPKLPALGNWLRTRNRLEDPSVRVSEAEQEN